MRFFIFVLFLNLCFVSHVNAQNLSDENRITGLDVELYFDEVEALFNVHKVDSTDLVAFVSHHVADDFSSLSSITSGGEVEDVILDKNEFISSLENGFDNISDTALVVKIKNIEFLGSFDQVAVRYDSHFSGSVVTQDKNQKDLFFGLFNVSSCVEKFRMQEGVLKLFEAKCNIERTLKKQSRTY